MEILARLEKPQRQSQEEQLGVETWGQETWECSGSRTIMEDLALSHLLLLPLALILSLVRIAQSRLNF